MTSICPECGASVPVGGTCLDNFHLLLGQEWEFLNELSDGRGHEAHYHAVSAYILQHPNIMEYSKEAQATLQGLLSRHLNDDVSISEIRRQMRTEFDAEVQVVRRSGGIDTHEYSWTMNVEDVLSEQLDAETYADRVSLWVSEVIEALERSPER